MEEAMAAAACTEGCLYDVEMRFLFAAAARPTAQGEVLEIGSYKGKSTILLAKGCRTLGEMFDAHEFESYHQARERISGVVRYYNEERLHSASNFLRPVDMYRGAPEEFLEERKRKLAAARYRRYEADLGLRRRSG